VQKENDDVQKERSYLQMVAKENSIKIKLFILRRLIFLKEKTPSLYKTKTK